MAPPPPWLAELADRIAALMRPMDFMAPIGCHYHFGRFPKGQWEITLFAGKTEMIGGSQDGSNVPSRFTVDLEQLVLMFSEVSSLHWQALAADETDDLGAHISIEGYYQSHSVWVRILSEPPANLQTSRYAYVSSNELMLRDVW